MTATDVQEALRRKGLPMPSAQRVRERGYSAPEVEAIVKYQEKREQDEKAKAARVG